MKNLLLCIIFIASFTISGSGQSYVTQYPDSSTAWYTSPGDFNVYNTIKNITQNDIYIKWRIISHDVNSGWLFRGFCDNFICYGENEPGLFDGTAAQVSSAYDPGVFEDFHALFNGDTADYNSMAWIKVLAADTVNNDSKTLKFIARKGTLGVEHITVSGDEIVLFPNPAQDEINILFEGVQNVKNIILYNCTGKVINNYEISGKTSAKLQLRELSSGIYFVRLNNSLGQTLATKRFIRN